MMRIMSTSACTGSEPTEAFLRVMAVQMESPGFGMGGRNVPTPSTEQLESVTEERIANALEYFRSHNLDTILNPTKRQTPYL